MIHAPSLVIGAIIASITIIVVMIGINDSFNKEILSLEPTPEIEDKNLEKITMETFVSNGSPILGNPNASITLVEFGDYQCHYCNVFFHTIENDIITDYVETGKVKMIFKDYNIIGADSISASHGTHCASDQGLFWEYHDILYSNWTGENNGWASPENLVAYAEEINLELDIWTQCMNEKPFAKKILTSNEDAKKLQLTGTPAFFVINSEGQVSKLFGAQPFEVFKKIFDDELE
ncbi:MAG TPA: DsbA family protein [Nitrosopumilus sp.]|nr:DsbA family protein [Nitrosopumilus sp.]